MNRKTFFKFIIYYMRGMVFLIICFSLTPYAHSVDEHSISNNQGYEIDFALDGKIINLVIPMASIGADVTLRFSYDPLTDNIEVNANQLRSALESISSTTRYFSQYLYELVLYEGSTVRTNTFLIPLKLEVTYADADQDGIVDGSNPMIFEDTLKAYYLDSDNTWEIADSQDLDTELNTVTIYISSACTFALMGTINYSENEKNVLIYPNPYMPGSNNNFSSSFITFDRITVDSVIKIYNLGGEFIKELKETDTDGRIIWNAKNTHGVDVASGVYVALIKGKNERKIYRFAIER